MNKSNGNMRQLTASEARKPQEPSDPRDFPEDASHENGRYMCYCLLCDRNFYGHKRRVVCKLCTTEADYLKDSKS